MSVSTPDDKAYLAHVAEARDALAMLQHREGAAAAAYEAALELAAAAENQGTETAAQANELVERSLKNAWQGVEGLVEETLIPPRMRPAAVPVNVRRTEVLQSMADLNTAVITLRTLADRARRAPQPAPSPPTAHAPPVPVQDSRPVPWPLIAGITLALILMIVILTIPR